MSKLFKLPVNIFWLHMFRWFVHWGDAASHHICLTTYQVMQLHVAVKIAVIFHFVFSSLRDKTKC